jgi:hypothetical protein
MAGIEDTFRAQGFSPTPQPQDACPELDHVFLSSAGTEDFTEYYCRFLAWYSYCQELLSLVEGRILQEENTMDVLAAETRTALRGGLEDRPTKIPQAALDDRLLTNKEYQECLLSLQRYQQSKKLLSARLETLERSLRVISRQITLRGLDLETTRLSEGTARRARFNEGT